MKIFGVLEALRDGAYIFTFIYIWMATAHYSYFNINPTSGNAIFYGGMIAIILSLTTAPKIKKWLGGKTK